MPKHFGCQFGQVPQLKKTYLMNWVVLIQILKLGEDFDLWVRIASRYPVAFLNKPLSIL
jgi:hypothetical protein